MANTGATLIGSYQTIDLGNGVLVSAYPSQHSCVWTTTQMAQPGDVCLGDLGITFQDQEARMQKLIEWFGESLDPVAIGHLIAGALAFLLHLADGAVLFQDTSGHWLGVFGELRAGSGQPRRVHRA